MNLKEAREIAKDAKAWEKKVGHRCHQIRPSRAIIALDNRITELEDCLKWYADVHNYLENEDEEEFGDNVSPAYIDGGIKARQILEAKDEKE